MSGNGNQVPLAPSQRGPGPYPRVSTPHRAECYHQPPGAGGAYMQGSAGNAQGPAQTALRVQPAQQPTAPPAPQQDMNKPSMPRQAVCVPPNQAQQARPFPNFPYKAPQHGSRPNPHARPQQTFISGSAGTAPMMYHQLVYQQPIGLPQSFQQQRPQGYYQYMNPYVGFNNAPNHGNAFYQYAANNPPLATPALQANAPTPRAAPSALLGPQGSPSAMSALGAINAMNAPSAGAAMPQPQLPAHMHAAVPAVRPTQPKRSHAVPIIDPATNLEIKSDTTTTESQYLGGDSSERQTPQPETSKSVAVEFKEMVMVANQSSSDPAKTPYAPKSVEMRAPAAPVPIEPQLNHRPINIVKSEVLPNENRNAVQEVVSECNEPPVVSAISDSPVIVPKMSSNSKQKIIDPSVIDAAKPSAVDVVKIIQTLAPLKQPKGPQNLPRSDDLVGQVEYPLTPLHTPETAPTSVTQTSMLPPMTQRIPRERHRSEEKADKLLHDKDANAASFKSNGPNPVVISSGDSLAEIIKPLTSQSSQITNLDSIQELPTIDESTVEIESPVNNEIRIEPPIKTELRLNQVPIAIPTATQLLSASIEKIAKEQPTEKSSVTDSKEASSAIQAQAKLTQSIASCTRTNQPETTMKDINLNNKVTDSDDANGNTSELTDVDTVKEDINKNEKIVKNIKNSNKKSGNKMSNSEPNANDSETIGNGNNETDNLSNIEDEMINSKEDDPPVITDEKPEQPAAAAVPKYKYTDEQWSPFNKAGKKCYDLGLLKQIKEDPLSKNKPNVPLLEVWNIIRTTPILEPISMAAISRPMNELFLPNFAPKSPSVIFNRNANRDVKKGNFPLSGKGSAKLMPSPGNSSSHKPVIHVSLSLRVDVKLNESENAWKPSRVKRDGMSEEDARTEELYKKFRGILNKLTPQKFDTLLEKVRALEINTKKRLEGVIDLVFEKAIDEPNFSEAYANMCQKLSMLKVQAEDATSPDQCVNFRTIIITKCQNQFMTEKVDETIQKLETELNECTDPVKKKELQAMLNEEQRRIRMKSVGNVRFIGELYKLKMLTFRIMAYCMNDLIDKLEEEKLECLCKLLTTIGGQAESDNKNQMDEIFKKMQEIVEKKTNKISSRVRFMLQDVIELRSKKWITKGIADSQPKMMDQIKNEAEQHQRHIELMNSTPMGGGFRRDDGNRGGGKRNDSRRQNNNNAYIDSTWKSSKPIDSGKLKAAYNSKNQSLSNIKLGPTLGWTYPKTQVQTASNSMTAVSKNNYFGILDNTSTDPTSNRGNKEITNYSKGASIERSTFHNQKVGGASGSRSGSMNMSRSNSSSRSASQNAPALAPPVEPSSGTPAQGVVPQEPLPDNLVTTVRSSVDDFFKNPDENELLLSIKMNSPQHHADVVRVFFMQTVERSFKEIAMVAKVLLPLVPSLISAENFVAGFSEIAQIAPDLYIDIPLLYDNFAKLISPLIEKKLVSFSQILAVSEPILSANEGHLLLGSLVNELKESMGASFVKSKWMESGCQLKDFMKDDQVAKWKEDSKFGFLEDGAKACEETKKTLTPAETQSKLLQLMNSNESFECIKGWVQDNLGEASNEDWFMRALIQGICEYSLFDNEWKRVTPRCNKERMNKYCRLINEFGGDRHQEREASCLFGLQQLIRRLEYPQGLTLELFQYLHDLYLISVEGFLAWEESDKEPEGKGVILKMLTSFFISIKEGEDNEDTCSEN